VTVSIRRMSLGSGFAYLMNSVARGDAAIATSSPLTRYYAESGTPPGRFVGSGLAGLDRGRGLPAGTVVSEEALWRMLGMMADPVTGLPLGRRPKDWPTPLTQRVATRVAALPASLSGPDRAAVIDAIEAEERQREASISRPVAAFDLTFSVPKSVSVLWALAEPDTQTLIYRAHQDAIQVALAWAEQNVIFTRTGAGGRVQEEVRGVVAAAFDHWDSRAGDPHLHTHVVVANRVQGLDGQWRSLDGATLFRYTVALSELHEGVLQDLLTDRLGVAWEQRARHHSAVPRHDLAGVPTELIEEFSTRSREIAAAKDELVQSFHAQHGRHPSNVEVIKLRQQATLSTRPDKQHHTLTERMSSWRRRASRRHSRDPTAWIPHVLNRTDLPSLDGGTFTGQTLNNVAAVALETVAAKRATFGHANLLAEVHRQLHGLRFATATERLQLADRLAHLALEQALPLRAAGEAVPEYLQRPDGTSKLHHRGTDRYTTTQILDAETRLLEASTELTAPAIPASWVANVGTKLGDDQRAAITAIATSGRVLDLLVGPAGTGKTTSLSALKCAWETHHGPGSVVGLAPSAAAAQVLGDELGIPAENTAKWLIEQTGNPDRVNRLHRLAAELDRCSSPSTVHARRLDRQLRGARSELDLWSLHPGQLVLIDEASLAGTLTLDTITTHARHSGAKIVLVGDWAQLGAIEAGGAFHLLASRRPDTPELTAVRRFHEPWEADASTRLRTGDASAIDDYLAHDRVHSGNRAEMLHALFDAWRADVDRGLTSAMIAPDDDSVRALNALAQAHRRDSGATGPGDVRTADGHLIGVGDTIVTRRNDRRLRRSSGWVKNGDTWTVATTHSDGSVTVISQLGDQARLPADYVTGHVELGYASTLHRAQGTTVDTAHALITTGTTREALYVATTRARSGNNVYVDTASDPDPETLHNDLDPSTARAVLASVLARCAAETSAHAVREHLNDPNTDVPPVQTFGFATDAVRHPAQRLAR